MCIIFAGGLQILFGLFKMGFFANYIPNNVILGLLAAIGVILIATQIPYLLGLGNFSWRELWSDQGINPNIQLDAGAMPLGYLVLWSF